MAPGTAMARLRVLVMLDLLARLDRDRCFRCGERITAAEELSVEHKIAWLDNDPQLFWDRANIAFSHRRCNSKAASRVRQGQSTGERYRKVGPEGAAWCSGCRAFLPEARFRLNRSHWNGLHYSCKGCERQSRRQDNAP
jgi:hypothetical protein